MSEPLRQLRPVVDEPDTAPHSCRNCQKRNRKIEKLQKDKAALEKRIEHLLRAPTARIALHGQTSTAHRTVT